ncbi:response regulator transcription factor [Kitasatospora sp. NPDC093558]|uniref:response regulator transcription factor n=1 Tax=Kitasatospora sp. NPDC093558 TaxID=3155201 RepID=UPI003427EA13
MTTVLVVDDQVLIRAGLVALIQAAPGLAVCGQASDGQQAVDLAAELRPDVVLMDIRMPDVDGIAATERILAHAAEPRPRVLVLTTFDLDEYVYGALRVGASGFLLKETPPERLLTAIEVVAGGDMLFAPGVTCRLIEAFAQRVDGAAEPPRELTPLTSRELDVLRLVGAGLSNSDIAGRLVVTVGTVKTHLNRIMTKLGISSRAQAVVLAYESGLITPRRPLPG